MDTPIRIPLTPVESSAIAAVGFDDAKRILAIEFKSGHIRHYAGVEPDLALELLAAPSVGSYFGLNVRGKFRVEQMTGVCANCGDIGWIDDLCVDCEAGPYARALAHCRKHRQHREACADCLEAERSTGGVR